MKHIFIVRQPIQEGLYGFCVHRILLVGGWQALMREKESEVIQFIIILCTTTFTLVMMKTYTQKNSI